MPHKLSRSVSPLLKARKSITPPERRLIRDFIDAFRPADVIALEIRVSSKQVKEFLEMYRLPYKLTFTKFNRLASCLGRTTGNMYSYNIPILLSISEPAKMQFRAYRRKLSASRIRTIPYYGSKRTWQTEYTHIFTYASESLKCNTFVDCFAGSAFLSLLASKLQLFDTIIANDVSPSAYNFHSVMKDDAHFEKFVNTLSIMPHVNKEAFYLIRSAYYNSNSFSKDAKYDAAFEGREKHIPVQTLDSNKALCFYLVKHYAFNSQGGFIGSRPPAFYHADSLRESHKLYASLTLKNLYYKKVLTQYLADPNAFIFLDPPYLKEVRVQKSSYEKEFSKRQHRTLMQLITSEKCSAKILLCGYKKDETENDMYSRYMHNSPGDCQCYRFRTNSMPGNDKAKEHIWTNFDLSEVCYEHPDLFEEVPL